MCYHACRVVNILSYYLFITAFKKWYFLLLPTYSGLWILSVCLYQFSSVQSLSRVQLFVTPWIAARQASLSIANSRSSLKLMSIESVMPSSHLASESFPMSRLFAWGGQSTGVSALAFVYIVVAKPSHVLRIHYSYIVLWNDIRKGKADLGKISGFVWCFFFG